MRPALWLSAELLALVTTCATAAALGHPRAVHEGVVVHIEDGDTIDVRIGDRVERVRYIGIDAPEVPHHDTEGTRGGESARRLNRALAGGRRVSLELDAEERDHYGRLLAYVRVGDRMINLEMVRRGYARVLTIPPNTRYERRFEQAETEARVSGRGLWGSGDLGGPTSSAPPPALASRTAASRPRARAHRLTNGRHAAPHQARSCPWTQRACARPPPGTTGRTPPAGCLPSKAPPATSSGIPRPSGCPTTRPPAGGTAASSR